LLSVYQIVSIYSDNRNNGFEVGQETSRKAQGKNGKEKHKRTNRTKTTIFVYKLQNKTLDKLNHPAYHVYVLKVKKKKKV